MTQRLLRSAIASLIVIICAVVVIVAPSASAERALCAVLLVFVLPGVCLLAALPGGAHRPGWFLLVPALSLAVVVLDSAALYVLGIRLGQHSWAISIAVICLIACVITGAIPHAARAWLPPLPRSSVVLPVGIAAVLVAGLLTATTLATVASTSTTRRNDRFTQLWALPGIAGSRTASIGIFNHEGGARTYTLQLSTQRRTLRTLRVDVPSGGSWRSRQRYPRRATYLRVVLRMSGNPAPVYRWVQLRLAG